MKIMRRAFVFLLAVSVTVAAQLPAHTADEPNVKQNYLTFVGTYTTKTASKGIYAFRYDAGSGKLVPLGVAAETTDPSWVAIHPNGKYLYAANEVGKNSTISAFAIDARSGKLTPLDRLPALGEDPCYLSFDKTGKYLFVANYTSGNVVVFPLGADGKLGAATANVHDEGNLGPNKERQEGPHAHWIEPSRDNRFALVADLGLDEVLVYRFDAKKGTLSRNDPSLSDVPVLVAVGRLGAKVKPGAGPRHFAFHPNGKFGYVLNEMDATVLTFSYDSNHGSIAILQSTATLPLNFSGRNDAAEIAIHANGKFLYASNRGHDSIALFHIDPTTGKLNAVGDFPVEGKEPRHFAIDPSGNFLLAEDQLSDRIVTFRIDQRTGALTPKGDTTEVPSPVCIGFLSVE